MAALAAQFSLRLERLEGLGTAGVGAAMGQNLR